jgi:hypothetical protein
VSFLATLTLIYFRLDNKHKWEFEKCLGLSENVLGLADVHSSASSGKDRRGRVVTDEFSDAPVL